VIQEERIVTAELDLDVVRSARRFFDPVGHYDRPDVFRLAIDTAARPAVVQMSLEEEPRPLRVTVERQGKQLRKKQTDSGRSAGGVLRIDRYVAGRVF
jgi:hypothetical protein